MAQITFDVPLTKKLESLHKIIDRGSLSKYSTEIKKDKMYKN